MNTNGHRNGTPTNPRKLAADLDRLGVARQRREQADRLLAIAVGAAFAGQADNARRAFAAAIETA